MRRAEATPVNIDCLAQTVKDSGLPYAAGKDYEVGDIVSFFYTASPWEDVPHFCLVQAVYGVVYKKGVDKRGNVVEVPFNRRLELAQEVESHIEKLPPLEQSLLKREFGFEGDKESLGKIGESLSLSTRDVKLLQRRALKHLWKLGYHFEPFPQSSILRQTDKNVVFRNDVPDLHDFEIEVYHLSKEGRNKLERTRMPNDDCWSAIFHSEHLITEAFNEKAVAWKLSEEDRVEIARQLQEFLEKKRQEKIAAIRKKEERIPRNTLLEEIPLSSETLEAIDKVRIDDLGLPISLRNTLFRARHYKRGLDLDAVGEVMALTKEQLFDIKQFGSKSAFILGRRLQDLIDPDGTNYEKDLFSNLLVSACPKTSRKHKIPGLEISVTQLLNAHFNAQTFVELRAFLKGLTLEEWQKLAKSSLKKNRKLSVFTKMARSILDSESENREGMLEEMLKFLREKDPDAISILNSRLTIDYYRRDKILSGLSERHEKFLAEHKEELKEQTDEVMYQELIKIDSRFEKGQIKGDEVFKYLL